MYDLSTTLNLTLSNITQATSLAIKLFLGKPVRTKNMKAYSVEKAGFP